MRDGSNSRALFVMSQCCFSCMVFKVLKGLQGLQIKPSVKTCDCEAAYVRHAKIVIVVVVVPNL